MHTLAKMAPATMKQPRQRRAGSKYKAPLQTAITRMTLQGLLAETRDVIPEQQARLHSDSALWCVGDVSLVRKTCVAIVGTREVSEHGAARSRRLARELASAGMVVVSGLARGVDTEALTSAMRSGGKVVAVIGTPVDRAYPSENAALQEEIYRDYLLVSQFAPGERVYPSNFPERNKLMAAISDATVIIEAGDTSGTLHQAAECVRLGRWLFIAKSIVDDASLQWPKRFLQDPKVKVLSATSELLSALHQSQ